MKYQDKEVISQYIGTILLSMQIFPLYYFSDNLNVLGISISTLNILASWMLIAYGGKK